MFGGRDEYGQPVTTTLFNNIGSTTVTQNAIDPSGWLNMTVSRVGATGIQSTSGTYFFIWIFGTHLKFGFNNVQVVKQSMVP
jgi:hypothetical protein